MNGLGVYKAVLNPYFSVAHFRDPVLNLFGAGDTGVSGSDDLFQLVMLDEGESMKQFVEMRDDLHIKAIAHSSHMRNDNGIDVPYVGFEFFRSEERRVGK